MRVTLRRAMLGPLSALVVGILAAGMAGGCSEQPATGTPGVESPEVQKSSEESIKGTIPRTADVSQSKKKAVHRRESIKATVPGGAHDGQASPKAAHQKAASVYLGGAGAFPPGQQK
jgi:hypothetical protein